MPLMQAYPAVIGCCRSGRTAASRPSRTSASKPQNGSHAPILQVVRQAGMETTFSSPPAGHKRPLSTQSVTLRRQGFRCWEASSFSDAALKSTRTMPENLLPR